MAQFNGMNSIFLQQTGALWFCVCSPYTGLSTLRLCTDKWRLHGSFQNTTISLLWLFTLPCNVNHASSEKTWVPDQEIQTTNSYNNLQYQLLTSQYWGTSCCTAPILYGHTFESFDAPWKKDFDNPLQLKHDVFILFLSSTDPVGQNTLTILYTVPLYGTDDTSFLFTKHLAKFCHDTYSA
jgi:hypothetical protein